MSPKKKIPKWIREVGGGVGILSVLAGIVVVAPVYITYCGIKDYWAPCPSCGKRQTLTVCASDKRDDRRCCGMMGFNGDDNTHDHVKDKKAATNPIDKSAQRNTRKTFTYYECSSCGSICKKVFAERPIPVPREEYDNLDLIYVDAAGKQQPPA